MYFAFFPEIFLECGDLLAKVLRGDLALVRLR
jgi:hypothetical protein